MGKVRLAVYMKPGLQYTEEDNSRGIFFFQVQSFRKIASSYTVLCAAHKYAGRGNTGMWNMEGREQEKHRTDEMKYIWSGAKVMKVPCI